MIATLIAAMFLSQGSEWSLEHNTIEQGPATVHYGHVRLHMTKENPYPCMTGVLLTGKGSLSGPPTSSTPNEPLLPFDTWEKVEGGVRITFCRSADERQLLPVSPLKNFYFVVTREEFDGKDMAKLLGDWGKSGSFWDLNGDGVVDGGDLTILLAKWATN